MGFPGVARPACHRYTCVCVCTRIKPERNFRPEDFVELIPEGQEIANKILLSPVEINPSRATDDPLLYFALCLFLKLYLDDSLVDEKPSREKIDCDNYVKVRTYENFLIHNYFLNVTYLEF